jgi:succinate dehydrogenase / fumarate reductase iron-sulfur subunit
MSDKTSQKKKVILKIKRQPGPNQPSRWEEFSLDWRPSMNVIIALRDIAETPVTREGKKTTPLSYDSNCLEEICGSCAMLINGKARMACSALIDNLEQPIRIEPLSKFPVVRDLAVDRNFMFESLKRVKAWIPIDGTYDLGQGPRVSPEIQEKGYPLSNCITCGSCLEVCPQVNEHSQFIGAAIISQVRLFNMHPTGAMHAGERLEALMGPGGIADCANAQNCVEACPKGIPLTESIAQVNRDAWKHALLGWLWG